MKAKSLEREAQLGMNRTVQHNENVNGL